MSNFRLHPLCNKSESVNSQPEPTFDELMQVTYQDVGISGPPFAFPAFIRRIVAWCVSFDVRLWAFSVWILHRTWGFFGQFNANPLAKSWSTLARQYSLRDAVQLARAVRELDQHPTFQHGCRELKFRNCLEAMYYRGSFLDAFYRQGHWKQTEYTHPHQRPSYFVPGIPAHQFYDPQKFDWAAELEHDFSELREELNGLLPQHDDAFGTFVTEFDNAIAGWNTFPFYANGRRQTQNCLKAPVAAAVAQRLLEYEEGELTMFSALNAGSYIPPHVGPLNGILRGHLPLLVSDGCGLKVGEIECSWQEGKVLVFDDSFVHTVWNHSPQVRIVLFFNIWHPCLSEAERQALANLRRAYNQTSFGRNWLKRQEESRTSTMQVASVPDGQQKQGA